jgi:hypothetical protein
MMKIWLVQTYLLSFDAELWALPRNQQPPIHKSAASHPIRLSDQPLS